MKRYFSTLCGIHCSLSLPISYTEVTAWCRRYLECWRKLQNLHAARSLNKECYYALYRYVELKLSSFPNIRDPVVCVLSIPRFLAILHQTHQNICWGDDEALPMNRQFQRSKPRNRRLSKWGTPKTFLLKMVSRSCKWICFGAMDFETHPSFADCADSPEAAECWICTDHPGYQVFG